MVKEELKKRKLSVYECSRLSNIPYTTLLELVNNKSKFENCSIKTIVKLSDALKIPLSELISMELEYRMPFEEFKSEICHKLKSLGHIGFLKDILSSNIIIDYYNKHWYEECYYTLALTDYRLEQNHIPLAKEYHFLRNKKLKNILYPRDIIMTSKITNKKTEKSILEKAMPAFLKYNIVETDINDAY